MGVPTVYRWDDANAPVLDNTAGALINVLRSCLVDGYGDKTAAGWTIPFANAGETVAAFRNDSVSGNGVYMRVDENTVDGNRCKIAAYEAMTSIDTGTGLFTELDREWYKANEQVVWVLIADDRFMYFQSHYSTSPAEFTTDPTAWLQYQFYIEFGDFQKNNPSDGFNSFISIYTNWSGYSSWGRIGLSSTDYNTDGDEYTSFSRKLSGETGLQRALVVGHYGPYDIKQDAGSIYDGTMPLLIQRPMLLEARESQYVRGYLPGFHICSHNYRSFYPWEVVTQGDRTFIVMKFIRSYSQSGWHDGYTWVWFYLIEVGAEWTY